MIPLSDIVDIIAGRRLVLITQNEKGSTSSFYQVSKFTERIYLYINKITVTSQNFTIDFHT